jgi:hypothetical protein
MRLLGFDLLAREGGGSPNRYAPRILSALIGVGFLFQLFEVFFHC